MNPARPYIILLCCQKDVSRCNSSIFYPELSAIQFDHNNYDSISANDLAAAQAFTGSQIDYPGFISDDNEFDRAMTEGTWCGKGHLHDLF